MQEKAREDQGRIVSRSAGHFVRQLRPGFLQITFLYPAPTNCWLLQESDGLTLIDSGSHWNAKTIMDVINSTQSSLRRIIITHAHPDHAGSAAEISRTTGAEIFAHEAELPYLEGHRSMADLSGFWMTRLVLKSAKMFGMLDPPPCVNVQAVSAGDKIAGLEILDSPGHTPGSISLWAEAEQALFCGDNLINTLFGLQIGLPFFTLDLDAQSASLIAYAELPARLILSGHGPFLSGDLSSALRKISAKK